MDPNWIRVREHNVSFDDLLDKRHLLDLAEVTRDKLVKVHASTDRFTHVVPAIPYNPLVGGSLIFIDQGAYLLVRPAGSSIRSSCWWCQRSSRH